PVLSTVEAGQTARGAKLRRGTREKRLCSSAQTTSVKRRRRALGDFLGRDVQLLYQNGGWGSTMGSNYATQRSCPCPHAYCTNDCVRSCACVSHSSGCGPGGVWRCW